MAKDIGIFDFSNDVVKRTVINSIKPLSGLHWFTCRKCRDQRTLSQNSYYWSCVLPVIAKGIEEVWGESIDADEAHEFCKDRFLTKPIVNRRTGEQKGSIRRSSTDLDTAEFAEYLDKIIKFAAEYLGVSVPPPKINREED